MPKSRLLPALLVLVIVVALGLAALIYLGSRISGRLGGPCTLPEHATVPPNCTNVLRTTGAPTATPTSFFRVDVGGGRTITIVCQGRTESGRPTVVFENGAGPTMSTWSGVMSELTATDRACAYDRAGTGQSDPAPGERTTRDQVADLAAALDGAGVTGSIVLAAHSRGGWNAILYTADHPEQVAGVVLVDIEHPGLDEAWLAELPPESASENPDITEARGILTDHSSDPSVTAELLDLDASRKQVEAAVGFGSRPTEILWATKTQATEWPPSFDADLVARLNAAFENLRLDSQDLARNPGVTRVETGHSIQEEQPAAVVDAINRVLAKLQAP